MLVTTLAICFARCFLCGLSLLYCALYGFLAVIYIKDEKFETELNDYYKSCYIFPYCGPLLLLGLIFFPKALFNWNMETNQKRRDERILYLRIGVTGMGVLAAIQYAIVLFMNLSSFWKLYPYFVASYYAIVVLFGWFVMEESYWCRFSRDKNPARVAGAIIVIVGLAMWFITGHQGGMIHGFYIGTILLLLNDSYILFTNPSEILFLRPFYGKEIAYVVNDDYAIVTGTMKGYQTIKADTIYKSGKDPEKIDLEYWFHHQYIIDIWAQDDQKSAKN